MPQKQLQLELRLWEPRSSSEVLASIQKLRKMLSSGLLGGEVMPEDANPRLPRGSSDNYHFFTLPMALNYQRNSYVLWQCASQTYNDANTKTVFIPEGVCEMDENSLRSALTKYKVAVQPNRHIEIWRRVCETISYAFDGDIRKLFKRNRWHIPNILNCVQVTNKAGFPYLSGPKICNYWLYVIDQYTDASFTGRESLSVAPDTHVIQASIKLGLIDPENQNSPNIRQIVSDAWRDLLKETDILPIDIHTPLWLWSRGGFVPIIDI